MALLKARSIVVFEAEAELSARYGGQWDLSARVTVPGAGPPLLMADFRPGIGCCTITALTTVLPQMQRLQSIRVFPDDPQALFDQIEVIAARHGYKPARGRTNPLRIGAIVRELFRLFSISGRAGSSLLVSSRKLRQEIDAGRLFLLNIAFGVYRRHSVAVVGYEIWQNHAENKTRQRLIWLVHDGWNSQVQRVDHKALACPCSRSWSLYSATRIRPDLPSR
ncbi:MAG: hypothetical protein EOM08_04170 [Clostridia bacterium]|nr:hypothetical protein [Clostridia bacterium]